MSLSMLCVFLVLRIFYILLHYFLHGDAMGVESLKSGRNVPGLGGGAFRWGLIGCSHIHTSTCSPHHTLMDFAYLCDTFEDSYCQDENRIVT
jgi:hypothetical protein